MQIDLGKAKELFLAVLEMPAPDRAAFLDTKCAGDTALRQRIEAMLRTHENSGELLPRAPAEMVAEASKTEADATAAFSAPTDGPPTWTDHANAEPHELAFLAPPNQPGHLGRLGHYEVHEVIGKGGFGVVLKAFDEKLHRVVAIKVLSPAYAANGSARTRFIREARTAAAVKNEHVVAIYGVEDEAQPPYLVMELIDGISLQDKLDKKGPLSLKEILRIGLQTAEGLAAAHKQGLVHRDIKPANILLENGVERVKITDFGLARAVDDASVTQSGTVAGTPMYMSPEQAEGLPVDHRSDLFSLGTMLYAMCTGHSPFRASGTHAVLKRVIDASPRPIPEVNNEIPQWLCDIIARLHAKKPEDRCQTAKEVAELLGQRLSDVQAGRAPMVNGPKVVLPPEPIRRRQQWIKALVLVGMGGVFTYAAAMLFRLDADRISPPGVQWLVAVVGLGLLLSGVFVAIPSLPGAGRARALTHKRRRQRMAFAIAGLALIVFVASAIWAGPFALRYLGNRGEVEITPESGWVSVIVHKDGNAVTDWFDVRTHPTIKLPAGTYKFPPGFGPGRTLDHWEVTTHGLFFSQSLLQFNRDPVFELARGERVTLRAVMRDEPVQAQAPNPAEELGWVQLFNGKDLTGWVEVYDKKKYATAPWDIVEPVLVLKGGIGQPTGYLRTEKQYREFHLRFEFKHTSFAPTQTVNNSHVYWGMQGPDDPSTVGWIEVPRGVEAKRADLGGGLELFIATGQPCGTVFWGKKGINKDVPWTNITGGKTPADTWNRAEIISKAGELEIRINGVSNVTKSYQPIQGHLGLFSSEQGLHLRNIEIKELPPEETGFVPLFNGKDLSGWSKHKYHTGNWHVADRQLICSNADNAWLFSDRADFKNFQLRVEYRVERGEASVILRASQPGDIEQPVYGLAPPGSGIALLAGLTPQKNGAAEGPAEWQSLDVTCVGDRRTLKRNGQASKEPAFSDGIRPGAGHIVLQSINAVVRFRKIEINELPPDPGDLPDWEIGLNLPLPDPGAESLGWFADNERIVDALERMH